MKNKLQLHLAASATAQKLIALKTDREKQQTILDDFIATSLEDKHYSYFNATASDLAYQYAALANSPLEAPKAAAPAEDKAV